MVIQKMNVQKKKKPYSPHVHMRMMEAGGHYEYDAIQQALHRKADDNVQSMRDLIYQDW